MRKFCFAVFIFIGLCAPAAQWTMTITQPTRCIPQRNPPDSETVPVWSAGAVSAGAYVKGVDGRTVYMATSSGVSSVAPSHRTGHEVAGGIGWLACTANLGGNGVQACLLDGNEVHFNRNAAASTNAPWTVKRVFDTSRGEWWFVPAGGGTSVVSFLEL